MSDITAILYFLPVITGVIADKIGYKLSLIIAYVLLISGYYFMGEVTSYTSVFLVFFVTLLATVLLLSKYYYDIYRL